MDSLSLLFPQGEQFFVDSVRHYRNRVQDAQLRQDVAGFIAQEAMHSKEHLMFNRVVQDRHLPVADIDAELKNLLDWVRRVAPPRVQLAATCALEHFTATMGEMLLTHPDIKARMSDEVRPLWMWHALEETEHKAVAYDVYEHTGGDYVTRVTTMAVATVIFIGFTARTHVRMLQADGQLSRFRQNIKGINYLFCRKGVLSALTWDYFKYYKPGFHPNQQDTSHLVQTWRDRLFGEQGWLKDQVKALLPRQAA